MKKKKGLPHNSGSISRIKGEFDETLTEKNRHKITVGIILVAIIEDETIGTGGANHQFKVIPQRRLLAQSREYQVGGLAIERWNLKRYF